VFEYFHSDYHNPSVVHLERCIAIILPRRFNFSMPTKSPKVTLVRLETVVLRSSCVLGLRSCFVTASRQAGLALRAHSGHWSSRYQENKPSSTYQGESLDITVEIV
jgi:hypothetical protein